MAAVLNRRACALAALLVAAASLAAAGQASASASSGPLAGFRPASSAAGLVTVQVNPNVMRTGPLRVGFIGLSFPSLELNDGQFGYRGNLPELLRNLGPGVMRFGGNAVDRSSFTGVTERAARELARLVRRTAWKVLYSVNLGKFRASRVTADARRVAAALGGHLLAIACGNEPELFPGRYRPSGYDEASYLSSDVPRCLRAVKRGAPRAPFAGPDIFEITDGPGGWSMPWLRPYAQAAQAGEIPGLSLLITHLYPMTFCFGRPSGGPAALLSRAAEEEERGVLAALQSAAATAGVPYLISESNSASCSGIPGVSNTFASALWSADWLMLAAERYARGIAFNGALSSACTAYTPLCETGHDVYSARPVYFGMLFTRMMGTGTTFFTPLTVSGTATAHVVTHSVVSSSGVTRVMVENLGGRAMRVLLDDRHISGRASAWYLTAPSLHATGGVRIQGATVKRNGTFRPGLPGHISCRAGKCRLRLPAYSAVIVRLPK